MGSAGILWSFPGLVDFCATFCVCDASLLILTASPSLDSTVSSLRLQCFLGLLLLAFLSLNSTNWLSSGFYSPLSRSFLHSANFITVFMQRTAVSLPGGCSLVCGVPHIPKMEPPTFLNLFSNCLLCVMVHNLPFFHTPFLRKLLVSPTI